MAARTVTQVPRLAPRAPDTHKGDYGRILIVAGGRGMAGAACLSGTAALRGGAGLVRVACPREIWPVVASYEPSYLTWPLAQTDDGGVSVDAVDEVLRLAEGNDYVLIGPGLGQAAWPFVRAVLPRINKPLVVDADGLNAIGSDLELLRDRQQPTVITPHPGEFARLTKRTTAEVQANRQELARAFAEATGTVVVLKGYHTVVTDGERIYINRTGNPGMATGGTGDVLSGLLAAFWAQYRDAFDAAIAAVYAHGIAGDHAALEMTETGLIASDLLTFLADALRELHGEE